MLYKIRIRKISFIDVCATILVILVFSFFEYTLLAVIAQVMFIIISFFESVMLKKQVPIIYIIWWVLFSTWCLLSYTWAINTSTVLSSFISVVQVALLSISIVFYVDSDRRVKHFINSMILSAGILCLRFIIYVPISVWGNGERLKGVITFYSNVAPMMLCFVTLILYNLFLKTRNKKLYILMIIFIFVSLLYGTRKALLILIVGYSIQLLLFAKTSLKIFKNIVVLLILALLCCYFILNIDLLYGAIGYRIEGMILTLTQGSGDGSAVARIAFIENAIDIFKRYPIIGVGLDGFRYLNKYEQTYAHNNYLELLCDLGIVGFIIYYSFHYTLLYKAFKYRQKDTIIYLVLAIVTSYLIIDFFNVSYSEELAHILLSFMFSIYRVTKFKSNGYIKNNMCYKGER